MPIKPSKPMTPNDIRAELVRKGTSAPMVARRCGVSNKTAHNVINGRSFNPIVQAEIAKTLEMRVESIFGSRTNKTPEIESGASISARS